MKFTPWLRPGTVAVAAVLLLILGLEACTNVPVTRPDPRFGEAYRNGLKAQQVGPAGNDGLRPLARDLRRGESDRNAGAQDSLIAPGGSGGGGGR